MTRARTAAANTTTGAASNGDAFAKQLLTAMLAFRKGDFAVRLPVELVGLDGKIADAFNDIVAVSERRARETARVSVAVGKEGRLRQRMSVAGMSGGWAEEVAAVNMLIDDLVWPTTEVTRAIGAVAKGDLGQSMALEVEGRPLEGEFLRSAQLVNKMIEQLTRVHVGGHARRSGGGDGGQARRPGAGEGRIGRVEGPDRVRQPDGGEPDGAGAEHRRRDHRGGQRRSVEEDHRRRPRGDPAAQGSHQHDGGPARGRSPRRSRAWRARWAPTASSAVRPSCPAWRGRGRTSPTTSTRWPPTSPARCGTSPRWRRRWPAATCRARSPWT